MDGHLIGSFDIKAGQRCAATRQDGVRILLEGRPEGGMVIDRDQSAPMVPDESLVMLSDDRYAFGI